MDQAEAARMRPRRRMLRLATVIRGSVVFAAAGSTAAAVMWFTHETPRLDPAEAVRESPLVEGRSLKPPMETRSVPLAAYGMNKQAPEENVRRPAVATMNPEMMPVWLVADGAQSAEMLRQELRDRGAHQMGQGVRLGMLKVAELMGMDEKAWAAGKATVTANENHTSALLLTFYLHHLEGAGDAAGVNDLRRAIEGGMPQDQAIRRHILAGRSTTELEKQMSRAYASVGIELQFTRRGGAAFNP